MESLEEKVKRLEHELSKAKEEYETTVLKNPKTIGARIKKEMALKGITQKALAESIDYTRQGLIKIINDETICSAITIGKIAEALSVSCDYLILGEKK